MCNTVFVISDILVRLRISDPYLWLADPDPDADPAPDADSALFVSDLHDANQKKIFL
jgi:hypothetical protein